MHFLLSLRSPAWGICKFLIQKIHFFLKSLWFLILKCYVRHIWCSFGIKLIQIHMICRSVSNFENRQSANESFIPTMVQKRGLDPQHWQEFFWCNKPWSQIFSNIQRQKIQSLWKDKTTDTAKNLDWNLTVFILYTQCIVYQWCFFKIVFAQYSN